MDDAIDDVMDERKDTLAAALHVLERDPGTTYTPRELVDDHLATDLEYADSEDLLRYEQQIARDLEGVAQRLDRLEHGRSLLGTHRFTYHDPSI